MGIQKTEAIVLKRQDLRETSLVAAFYTKDFGKIKGVLKGIKGPKSRFLSFLQPFTHNELIFYERASRDLNLVSQCELKDLFPSIRQDLAKIAHAYYLIELVDELTADHDTNPELFESLLSSLRLLSVDEGGKVASIFEVKLLKSLGLGPSLASCVRCGAKFDETLLLFAQGRPQHLSTKNGEIRFSHVLGGLLCDRCFREDEKAIPVLKGTIASISHIGQMGWDEATRLKLSLDVAANLREVLGNFLTFQIGKRLKSLDFIVKIRGREGAQS